MPHVLLTGAGFSHNWGGWLANEAFEYLLGCSEVDGPLRDKLWLSKNSGGGFEDALAALQSSQNTEEQRQLDNLTAALVGMFNAMGQGFMYKTFEPQSQIILMVRTFLINFNAIFTLNQDTLLEQHYFNDNIMLGSSGRWGGWELPGMPFLSQTQTFPAIQQSNCRAQTCPDLLNDAKITALLQASRLGELGRRQWPYSHHGRQQGYQHRPFSNFSAVQGRVRPSTTATGDQTHSHWLQLW
jgi:hypothetical protein